MRASALRVMVAVVAVAGSLVVQSAVANASVAAGGAVTFATPVTVGQTGLAASITMTNQNTAPQNAFSNFVCNFGDAFPCPVGGEGITVIPTCGVVAGGTCDLAGVDPDVFKLSLTGTGRAATACVGIVFNITLVDAVTGKMRFTPQPGGTQVNLASAGVSCIVDFTFEVLKMPTIDASQTPGVQTFQLFSHAQVSQQAEQPAVVSNAAGEVTVLPAVPTIATTSTQTATIGGQVSDTAVVSGRINSSAGATVTFRLYGPNDANCVNPAVFTSTKAQPVVDGPVTSDPFTATTAGTYRWIASYSGDVNNAPVAGLCNDPNESVVVSAPTIATTASANIVIGGQVTDSATVSGRGSPQASTIEFRLYGPNDAACAGAPVFTSTVSYLAASASVTSAPFTPTTAGTYQWRAFYAGDVNNAPASGPCNAANESVVVNPASPSIATTASAGLVVGGQVSDSATVSGRVNPLAATVTFNLFGPDNATCTGAPVFTSTKAYPPAGGAISSDPFTPTAAGTYRWVASYSGDANNLPAAGACNAANESVDVTKASPTIATTATGGFVIGSGSLTDSATVTGRASPLAGATLDFRLYGPNDATCSGTPVFQSLDVAYPVVEGAVTSGVFTPTLAGTYRWRASYSGDANNVAVAGACNDANETVVVARNTPQVTLTPSPDVAVGGSLSTFAAVVNLVKQQPGGTIDIRLYGPSGATCTGAPVFEMPNIPYPVATTAAPVQQGTTPYVATVPGVYGWQAMYSGDTNNNLATSPCSIVNVVVVPVTPIPPPADATLPETGTDVRWVLTLAIAVTFLGGVLVGSATWPRRRRAR